MVQFADRMDLLKGSAIRELLALANKPENISFAGGMPAPELFPGEKVMAAQALEKKVAYVPGEGFFPNGDVHNCMRLNYSNMTDEKIVKGITILADVIKANMK